MTTKTKIRSYALAFDNGFYKGHEDAWEMPLGNPAEYEAKARALVNPKSPPSGDLVDAIEAEGAAAQLGITVAQVLAGGRAFRDACRSWDLGYGLGIEAAIVESWPEIKGDEHGVANVEVVLGNHGAEAVIGTLVPEGAGMDARLSRWEEAARGVAAHTFVLGSEEWGEEEIDRFYGAYAAGARRLAEQIRDEQQPIAAVG